MAETDDRRPIGHLLQFAALVLFVFSLALVASGSVLAGVVTLGLGLAVAVGWFDFRSESRPRLISLGRALSLVVALLGLASLDGWLPELVFWNLLVPLLFFLLWPVRWAVALCLAFLAGVLVLTALQPWVLGMLRHQLVPALLLVMLLSGLFVYLRETKAQQLAPLRRTDALTRASTQEHLHADLRTEILRSEREGTALAVVHLALDPTANPLPAADQESLLPQLGRLLHEHLRPFDNYYRIDDSGFVLVLPCTETPGAVRQADAVRLKMMQSMKTMELSGSLSAGVTGLNVGDDAEILLYRATEGLERAQNKGGNRTQSWTESTENYAAEDRP